MKIEEPSSFSDLVSLFGSLEGFIFRGQSSSDWKLETSLERTEARRRKIALPTRGLERKIIRYYRRTAHQFLRRVPEKGDIVEWISILQHYGAPTRFIDFTNSIWIALFFALEDADSDCAIWAVPRRQLRAQKGTDLNRELGEAIGLAPYNLIAKSDKVYCDQPYYMHERLVAQRGYFVFPVGNSNLYTSLEATLGDNLIKIRIRKEFIVLAWKSLDAMNITAALLFPGIEGFSRQFKNHWI